MAQANPQIVNDPQLAQLRVPPHSIEAEQSVLGGLLLDNQAWERVADILAESNFYRDDHRRIYRHIGKLMEKNRPADMVTVFESIEQSEDKDKTGGLAYLGALAQNTPSAHNIRRYAEIVRERAIQRRLIEVGTGIADSALNPMGKEVAKLLDEAESRVFEIAEAGARGHQGLVEIQPILAQVMERIDMLYHRDNPSDITGLATGFNDLDQKTSGLQQGDLIIVAGRPSMGKTAFALNIAEHVAVNDRLPVAVFSMEMGGAQLAMRMLGSVGRLDQMKLRTGRLTDEDWSRLTDAVGKVHDAPIHIDETPALNCLELRARARRMHRQYDGLGLVVVDYLQLMSSTSTGENRATEISEISRSLTDAGRHVAADHTVVQHGDAGAADHGVELVAHHEFRQRTPQRHDDTAMAVVRMHAAAPQLHHAVTQAAQACQVKFEVAVGAAHALGLRRREQPVGAHHFTGGFITHQQMLAVVVKQINVVAGQGRVQAGAHLLGKYLVPQALNLAHFVLVLGPRNQQSTALNLRRLGLAGALEVHDGSVKQPPG